jgi:fucose 4-O-acetylase-like acetyltransferase
MTSTADWGTANSATTAPQSLEAIARRPDFLVDIERAKGLAIILVVIGHIVAREPPANNEWYVVLKTAIYAFHMPFLMYLGGLVFFHVGDAVNPRPSYGAYLIRRAERLLIPFLSLGLLILLGKFAAEQFLSAAMHCAPRSMKSTNWRRIICGWRLVSLTSRPLLPNSPRG